MAHGNTAFVDPALSCAYKMYRPTYPDTLYTIIRDFLAPQELPELYERAVDVGCGSGQVTNKLSPHFKQVLGIDISPTQIQTATDSPHPDNVQFVEASCFNIPMEAASVDLVTVGTAAHYFHPIEEFYQEALRVLKPLGVLAIFGYGPPQIWNNHNKIDTLSALLRDKMFNADMLLKTKFGKLTVPGLNKYKDFQLPMAHWERREDIDMFHPMTVASFSGFLRSLTYYPEVCQILGEDLIEEFKQRCQQIFDRETDAIRFDVKLSITLLIGRK